MPSYWLIKSEPSVYSWSQLVSDKKTVWDGVRSFEARNNLRAMKKGDRCLYYHSNEGKAVVGVAEVTKAAYQDPSTDEDWSVVELAPDFPLARPVTLDEVKGTKALSDMILVKKMRLSVQPVAAAEYEKVLELGGVGGAKPHGRR